jgi:hypothetical protein
LVVIVLLLAVWGGVGVWWFLSRPEGHATDSIGSFRQQLRVLERAGPTTIVATSRMDMPAYEPDVRMELDAGVARRPVARNPMSLASAAARRRRVQKRRREVFYSLVAGVVGAAILGFLPGLSVMWGLSALLAVVLALYVVVLVQLRAVGRERSQKVRFLTPPAAPRAGGRAFPGYAEPEPAYLLRRSAN